MLMIDRLSFLLDGFSSLFSAAFGDKQSTTEVMGQWFFAYEQIRYARVIELTT